MERFLFLKTLAKSILQQVFIIPAAVFYYKARLQKRGVYNLIICRHIGDFLYTMGYVSTFQKENNIKKLRIVSVEKFRELMQLYPNVNCEYHVVSENWLHILCIANRYVSGQQLFGSWKDCKIVEPANGFVAGFEFTKYFPQLNLKNCICQGTLRLKPDSRFDLPGKTKSSRARFEEAHKSQAAVSKGKILLCPYAQAIRYDDAEQLFHKLAGRMRAENYEVYVNAPQGQQIRMDAKAVHSSLKVLYENLGQYEAVIGIRSGLLDLAVFSGCRVTALYPPAYGLAAFYDLRHAGVPESEIFQYELTGNMKQDIDTIAAAQQR